MTTAQMTTEQFNYAKAKAMYDTVKAQVEREKQPIHDKIHAKALSVEEWAEQTTRIEFKYNFWPVADVLREAEDNLIAWSKKILQARKAADYDKIKNVFEGPIYNLELRQKLVDICFRLDTGTMGKEAAYV